MTDDEPQILTLSVTGSQAAQLGPRSRKMFVGKDGSIGRAEDCDWVLSATGVSRVHAMIRYVNGIYFVEDRSTNGVLLNGSPLLKGDPAALKDGDRIQIDAFDISVRLQQDSETIVQMAPPHGHHEVAPLPPPPPMPAGPADAGLLDFGLPPLTAAAPAAPAASIMPAASARGDSLIPDAPVAPGGDLDPLSFLGSAPPAPTPAAPPPSWNHSPSTEDYFRPPTTNVQRDANALPANWDDEFADLAPPAAAPAAPEPVAPPPVAATPVTPVAASPGPAPTAASVAAPAASSELDAIFRIVVDGVMDVLRARAEIKNTFRLPMTVIQKSENNPLKFAMGVDDALQKVLAPANPAFLSGTAAFEDAFDDIRCHQMAMLAGVRAGFESLLRHFDPERFEQEADAAGRHAFGGKGRYWERFREHYTSLASDPDECFRRLFGDEFARAYEEQLARLKSARGARGGAAH